LAQAEVLTIEPAIPGAERQLLPLVLVMVAAVSLTAALLVQDSAAKVGLLLLGAILTAYVIISATLDVRRSGDRRRLLQAVSNFIALESRASFITDVEGRILYRNRIAAERFQPRLSETLATAFNDLCATPEGVLFRLQERARISGSGREDIVTRRGHLRLFVQCIDDAAFLWRIEDIAERAATRRGSDELGLPMLIAGPTGTILYVNEAFRRIAGARAKTLKPLFTELPLVSGRVHELVGLAGPVDFLVADVTGTGGRREIYLLPAGAAGYSRGRGDWDAIEDLPVPLLKVAATGEVLSSNREARALFQVPMGQNVRLSDLLEGLGRPIIDWLAEAADGRGGSAPQFLRGTGENQDTFVQVSLNPAGPEDNPHLVAVLNDVTELKSLEAQFVQSQKMQAIGQLAGGVAHDFNNLLTAISGHCDLLLLRYKQGDPDYGDLIQIHQNANRAASLVGQLLAFSRKQNLRPQILDLRDTLSDLTHLLNRLVGEKVLLTLNHDPALLHIRADKRQIEQVLMNLVVNARDAMPGGGEIKVETENRILYDPLERDRVTVPVGSYVVVRVIDGGTGIAPEKLPKIFEPFYTTKRPGEGTGLGLSTAYGIVKQTGGFIFADSEVGFGATFTLYFPSHDKPLQAEAVVSPAVVVPSTGKVEGVVLLVEDEAPVRAFASRALRLRGYTVLEADSAETALTMLSDPALVVDLFVTDVIMPGKDGPTWVREALLQRPATKVVFISGYAEDAFAEHQALIPNSVFLPKPFSLTELTALVQGQL
jgi:two-component system, cell cycle sensor histidine kinase and response regulator CckA